MQADVTQMLARWSDGDRRALDELLPVLYDELRRLAHARLRGEPDGRTLDTTGLVHEAFLRLVDVQRMRWTDRSHFFAMASRTMRRILIDQARIRQAAKRGGGQPNVTLHEDLIGHHVDVDRLLDLDTALEGLEAAHPRQARAVELRYFGGLTLEEAADILDVSPPTVMRDVRFAEAWLARSWDVSPSS